MLKLLHPIENNHSPCNNKIGNGELFINYCPYYRRRKGYITVHGHLRYTVTYGTRFFRYTAKKHNRKCYIRPVPFCEKSSVRSITVQASPMLPLLSPPTKISR